MLFASAMPNGGTSIDGTVRPFILLRRTMCRPATTHFVEAIHITDLDQLLLQLSDSKSGAGAPIKAEQDILTGAQTFPP